MSKQYHPHGIVYPEIVDCDFQKWDLDCRRSEQARPIPSAR